MAMLLLSPVQVVLFTAIILAGVHLYNKLRFLRVTQNAHLPQLPSTLLWGHLKLFDHFTKQGPADRHPDIIFAEMHRELGRPPLMIIDNWPVVPPMVIVASHAVAEQITTPSVRYPHSIMKSPSTERIVDLIGPNSILLKKNEVWKTSRKTFNPGFAKAHLMTLLPIILEKANVFLKILDHFAETGESIELDTHTSNLTFDIIGAVIMDENMDAQQVDLSRQGELVRNFKALIKTFADDKLHVPWWLIPRKHFQRQRLGQSVTQMLHEIIQTSFRTARQNDKALPPRSIMALSLRDVKVLTPDILAETCDQLRTFLFAGHDATSSLLCWAVYELSRTPRALKAVQDEVDRLFGLDVARDPIAICQKLLGEESDELLGNMKYINAVVKECLRLWPPGASIRIADPGMGLVVATPQGEFNIDGNWIFLNQHIIHRDKDVFGETADEFRPERWLTDNNLPAGAWRPFERGPRNCIGQELATIEARTVIALLAHRYTFEKVGLGELDLGSDGLPILNDQEQFKAKSELYETIKIVSKPVDGMLLKVHRALPKEQ